MAAVDFSKIAISAGRGRYRAATRAPAPPGGLPKAKRVPGLTLGTAAVVDPYGDGRQLVQARVNRRGDVLETELAAGRISDAAYEVGRSIQDAVERMGGVRSPTWSDGPRIDAQSASELAVVRSLDNARRAAKLMDRVGAAVGTVGARFLRVILCDGLTFIKAAELRGRSGERAATFAGERFRSLLEDLATEWGAHGKTSGQILFGDTEVPDVAVAEPSGRVPAAPMVRGRAAETAGLGRQALDAAAGDDPAARKAAVRRSLGRTG